MKTHLLLSYLMIFSLGLSPQVFAAHHEAKTKPAWVLNNVVSKVAYGSIKVNTIGEANHFKTLSGGISTTGKVHVDIDLASVDSSISIRNERMIEHVFGGAAAKATLSANIDTATLKSLKPGDSTTLAINGILSFLGKKINIQTSMFIAHLGNNKLLATTDEMIMISTDTLGIDAGIDKLMQLAGLPSITRAVPVTLRLVFEKSE